MYAGVGRAGDFAGDPLQTVDAEYVYWLDAGQLTIRAIWTARAGLPARKWITYRAGVPQAWDVSSPQDFAALVAGTVPNLAAVGVSEAAYDGTYDPLGGQDVANLVTLKQRILKEMRGRYRIEDTSLERYELFRGVNAAPDFDAAAWQTFTGLPFTTPALTPGNTYQFVLRKRNKHNLLSQNVAAWVVTLDGGGASVDAPSAPYSQSIDQAADGAARIRADYDYLQDDEDIRADTWAVWLTDTGVAPDPDVDAADYTEEMIFADGIAKLDWTSGANADGATLKAIVRARRSGPVDSTNTDIMTVTADASGPAAPTGGAFLGQNARQA